MAVVASLALAGCASVPTDDLDAVVTAPASMPDRIHPPEEDVAWIRGYAASMGFSYEPWMEDLAVLQEFNWRAQREGLTGYVAAWGEQPRLYIDAKPPFDRGAVMALLAPELRSRVTIREVRYDNADIERLRAEMDEALRAAGQPESISLFSRQEDRMELVLTSEADAHRVREVMSPDLAAATHIEIGSSPLIVF